MAVGNPAGRNSPKRSVSHPRTFSRYAATCLQVRSKSGAVLPFRLNEAQRTLDRLVNRQRRETGRVRLLVLKARQMGVSTYVEGRFYWLTTQQEGVRSFILTYCLEDEAVPNPDIHCYRTLGNVTCYERPIRSTSRKLAKTITTWCRRRDRTPYPSAPVDIPPRPMFP